MTSSSHHFDHRSMNSSLFATSQRSGLMCMIASALLFFAQGAVAGEPTARYFVRLSEPSVTEWVVDATRSNAQAPSRAAQRAHTRQVREEQARMSRTLAPLVTREIGRLAIAVNGLKVIATPEQVMALRRSKGVRSVSRIAHHTFDNAASVAWVGAPEVWKSLGDGDGITIAIIDTGIDYLHANFGGDGDPDSYAANDKSVIEPGSFPTAKVIGGWDFAGPTYNSRVDEFPEPDPDPLDGNGHGSHVAGTAAGIGVPQRIGPGVAKGAQLLALKVFSDESGSTDLTADALDYALDPNGDGAIDDRVDVINMSLGARYGDQNDPSALASTVAAQAGVVVVASAGNNGDKPYVTGSPGVSPEVITVGATIAGGRPQIALRVLSDNADIAGLMPAQQGSGEVRVVDAPVTAPLVIARSPAVDEEGQVIDGEFDDRACRDLVNADEARGKVVLVDRANCSFEDKYASVEQAGARAILAYNSSESDAPFIMGGIGLSGKRFTIPGLMVSGTDALRLKAALIDGTPFEVQFDIGNTVPGPPERADQLTFFTSRGPASGGAQFKPDLSAPGRFVVSTAAGTGFRARQLRGTSMAAPHVAGAAALMRQRYPDLPVAGIKALLQNSTVTSDVDGAGSNTPAPLTRQGIGVMRIPAALALSSYAQPAGLSFGYALTAADESSTRTSRVTNLSSSDRVFSVTHVPRRSRPGLEVTCPTSVAVPASGEVTFDIELTVTAEDLVADPGVLDHAEIDGWCVLSDGIDDLRVGYIAARDPASAISVERDGSDIVLTNTGVARGRAMGFSLAATGGTQEATRTIGAVGFRQGFELGLTVFRLGLALDQTWETPAHLSLQMAVDAEQDGYYERILWAGDRSLLRFESGTYITAVFRPDDDGGPDTSTGYADWFSDHVDFNDQVMMLPWSLIPEFNLSFLKPGQTRFDFRLRAISRDGSFDEQTGTIDLAASAVRDDADLMVPAGESVRFSADAQPDLWLLPGNAAGAQYIVLPQSRPRALHSARKVGR